MELVGAKFKINKRRWSGRVNGLSSLAKDIVYKKFLHDWTNSIKRDQLGARHVYRNWIVCICSSPHSGISSVLDTGKSLYTPRGIRDGLLLLYSLNCIPVISGKSHAFFWAAGINVCLQQYKALCFGIKPHCFLSWCHVSAASWRIVHFTFCIIIKKKKKKKYI